MDGMEDAHENELKRKGVDIQGESQSSSSSDPVNTKKRRLNEESCTVSAASNSPITPPTVVNIRKHVKFIRDHVESSCELDNKAQAVRALKGILKNDEERAETMVEEGAVSVLIQQLEITSQISSNDRDGVPADVEILEECALTLLKSLARKSDSARIDIIQEGAIPHFLCLLKRKHRHAYDELPLRIHRLVLKILELLSPEDMVNVLLADQNHTATEFALELLSPDHGVQLSALRIISRLAEDAHYSSELTGSSRFLAGQLTAMFSSKHVDIRWGAASAVLALSQHVWALPTLFEKGIVEPIVGLLHSSDSKSRSLGAQLVTRLTTARGSSGHSFLDGGALAPLLQMLRLPNLRRDAIFALYTFLYDCAMDHVILIEGGLPILMDLFFTREIQTDPEIAPKLGQLLLAVIENREGAARFVKMGGLRSLRTTKLVNDYCRQQTAVALWIRIGGRIGTYYDYPTRSLIQSIRDLDEFVVRARCAHALALFTHPYHLQSIFVFNNYLEILLQLYGSAEPDDQYEAAEALYNISHRLIPNPPGVVLHEAFIVPNPRLLIQVMTPGNNISFVNNPNPNHVNGIDLSDVNNSNYDITFLLDNKTKQLQAHKSVLRQASDVFRAMLSDNYNDTAHGVIEVPNISYSTFKAVIDFIYTGRWIFEVDDAYDILQAANFYDLKSLKGVCLYMIANRDLVVERVAHVYEFAEKLDVKLLMQACILFILEYHEQVRSLPWFRTLVDAIIPEIRRWFPTIIPGQHVGHMVPTYGL